MGLTPNVAELPKSINQAFQVNLDKLIPEAQSADVAAYDRSDKDFAARFPGIIAARNAAFKSAANDVAGPSPLAVGQFVDAGLGRAFASGLGGGEMGGVEGLGRNTVATTVANSAQKFQDTARQNLADLFQPEQGVGLTPDEVQNIKFANVDAINAAIKQKKAANFAQNQAQSAANSAGSSALIGIGTSLLGSVLSKV
jgi:hypothetical protein